MAAAPPGSVHLALLEESPVCRGLAAFGAIDLHNQPPGTDAFAVVEHEGALVLAATTPRGLLHAVYALADRLDLGEGIASASPLQAAFHIPRRIFHPRFDAWPGERADIRYISRIGASHCLVDHDWQGSLRNLQGYVTSPVFPAAVDPGTVARQHAGLRRMLDDCLDYGLEACLWLTELPCQGGPWVPEARRREFLTRFSADALADSGTYEGQVLCFSHPVVQELYRDLLERFFRDFPEIGILFVFGRDSSGEFCDPVLCPRCRGMTHFDQRDRLLRFLLEEGAKVRPGLQVLTTGWGWDHEMREFVERQRRLPPGCGVYLAAEKDGWQAERQAHDFLREVRGVCAERGQLFIGYDDLHWGDDTVHGLRDIQDYPLGVGAKIRRWRSLQADGVFDHWGTWSEDVSCNSVACRAFFLNPLSDPEAVCRGIASGQFGEACGVHVARAWAALERAHAVLSNACTWSPGQWPGWYAGRGSAPVPATFAAIVAGTAGDWRMGGELLKPNGSFPYNAGTLGDLLQAVSDAWSRAGPHYEEAVLAMRSALKAADDARVGYAAWWSGARAVPSRREHVRRQLLYLESMAVIGREMGLHFGLFALYERRSRDAAQFREEAPDLMRADRDACIAAALFVEGLGERCPAGLSAWPGLYRKKAREIEEYLAR